MSLKKYLARPILTLLAIFTAHNTDISSMYSALECEHYLIPDVSTKKPTVPALTPAGFAQWTILLILSYPEAETRRLQKVVQALPIDDDSREPERLPKKLSRGLFPLEADMMCRERVHKAISDLERVRDKGEP